MIDLQPILEVLGCPVKSLPGTVLRPPFVVTRLSKTKLQFLVDKVAGNVPTWISSHLKKGGRLVCMNSKLATLLINHVLSLYVPPCFFHTVNKLIRGFFWQTNNKGKERALCGGL
jgi:hypothetical protein